MLDWMTTPAARVEVPAPVSEVAEFEQSSRTTAQDADTPMAIRARGLTFERAGRRLIENVDLDVRAGVITTIMGPNGAGKSLLLRLLHGLIEPSVGAVTWSGCMDPAVARAHQAMVFQRPVLLRRSVGENIGFVLKLRGGDSRDRRRAILDHVGLLDRIDQPARLLSGGEQQRLALARALTSEPHILFLDEPTASLDPASALRIEQLVRDAQKRGMTIVFVTHDVGQAKRLADDVVFLTHGQITERSAAERFFAMPRSHDARAYLDGRLVV